MIPASRESAASSSDIFPRLECFLSPNLYAFFLFRLIRSPYPVHPQKYQTPQRTAEGIQEKVIHIKTSHFRHQLYSLYYKAQFKAEKCCTQQRSAFDMQNWQEETKGNECDCIPHKIQQHGLHSKHMAIFDKTSDFPEQLQIIMIGPALKSTSHTLCKKQKIC